MVSTATTNFTNTRTMRNNNLQNLKIPEQLKVIQNLNPGFQRSPNDVQVKNLIVRVR
jgi:hypothetical protein